MRPFNVEIFDRNFNFIHNYTVENPVYRYDYLTPVENTVTISFNKNVAVGQYIIISNTHKRYEGVVSSIQVVNQKYMTVGYNNLNNIFNFPTYIDIDYQQGGSKQGQKTIESIIYDNLESIFIDGHNPADFTFGVFDTDDLQKIPGLTLTKETDTMTWNIGLSTHDSVSGIENEWKGYITDDLFIRALKGCSVGVRTRLDIAAGKVYCNIGVFNSIAQTIEADLPQILKKNVVENDTSMMCNKFILYPASESGYSPTIYYRHSDGTWNTTNTDRLTPVIYDSGEPDSDIYEGDTVETRLYNKFGALKYVNLIELTTTPDTYDLELGDIANIIVGDKQYTSMLTGYEVVNDTIKYIFGMLRLDLTKILKGRKI